MGVHGSSRRVLASAEGLNPFGETLLPGLERTVG